MGQSISRGFVTSRHQISPVKKRCSWALLSKSWKREPFDFSNHVLRLYLRDKLLTKSFINTVTHNHNYGFFSEKSRFHHVANTQLQILDSNWAAHLNENDDLRTTTPFRAFGSFSPIEEYKINTTYAFQNMIAQTRKQMALDIVRLSHAADHA